MKKIMIPVLAFFMTAVFVACQKEKNEEQSQLTASKTADVKKGESVVFRFSGASVNDSVSWSVNPSAGVQVNATGNSASFKFAVAGNYVVTARFGSNSSSLGISVNNQNADTTVGGGTGNVIVPLGAGDKIRIALQKSAVDSNGGTLFLSALTDNAYNCLNNSLAYTQSADSSSFAINYSGVFTPSSCTAGTARAGAISTFYAVPNGSRTFAVTVKGVRYSGTIQRSGNSYSVSWPDSSVVKISPLNF